MARPDSPKKKSAIAMPADPWSASCPSRGVIEMLASKWVLLLVPLLRSGPKRNAELLRAAEGVSQKMLTQTLRALEDSGLVKRHDFQEVPPRVEYSLTPLGHSLAKAVVVLDNWVIEHVHAMPVRN